VKPFTFSNGVTIPMGVLLATPLLPVHLDETVYENADNFDGFRFSKKREFTGESAKHHSVNTSTEFLTFGHGEHAWYLIPETQLMVSPGRFFVINELKLMLAFILLRFDVKTKNGVRPKDWEFQGTILPDVNAEILFKHRSRGI
jgi:cytochrome P450